MTDPFLRFWYSFALPNYSDPYYLSSPEEVAAPRAGGGAGTSRADGWEGRAPARPSRGMERNLKPQSDDLITT